MRVTIIKDDNAVSVDGRRCTVDCGTLPADFHALQWYGTYGEVEYVAHMHANNVGVWHRKPNAIVHDLSPYQRYVDGWRHAADAEDAAIKAAEDAAAAKAEADRRVVEELAAQSVGGADATG